MKGQNIIIKKKKKGGHGGGHGGSWKVAYADFVTAMMAFFLLMWLLNMTSPSKKMQLSTYFKNLSMFEALSMSFVGKGKDVVDSAVTKYPKDEVSETIEGAASEGAGDLEKKLEKLKKDMDKVEAKIKDASPAELESLEKLRAALKKEIKDVEEKIKETESIGAEQFKEKLQRNIGENLKKEIGERNADLKDQVLIDVVEGGVRIQIVDKAGQPMFALGSPELTQDAKRLIKIIATDLLTLKGIKLSIEGHTDALSYSSSKYTNWELSTDRASAARKELERDGIDPNDLERVAGFAATKPLIADNPNDPRNRRITIMVYSTKQTNVQADILKNNMSPASNN
ncbi:flagellar motor protein MotB [Candidatus Magnetominusculus xianensis]|uniref:Chemotaxis protein MotB n=1 Tax=Candidatus Magnetominusculus xianensis TaxID=1748249 RepID=A0ABR5SIR3_9BACT|nr:flagellar motor protein MotB [Candidatus Magnetominusculus xianensis]KWT92843.1 chemotaxis protein MotB [Candidatus Magnetominusculus xianensis]MBF0403432.1 OmpA family protein [Nitrospirota bacterium]